MTTAPVTLRLPRGALRIMRRELKDQLRDWRILTPIIILTIFFPLLMNFTAQQAVQFVQDFGADIVAERLIPFLLMVVGFFPISVSLVIALESFAGERERLTLEPLLAAPLNDAELYLGKTLASLFLPLAAAYLGIGLYLVGLAVSVEWYPPPQLLLQVILLTGAQALLMVNGAVVVSSQTTSVRAANLLASFIIVPMSQLIIGESLIMFWGRYNILWWIVLALILISVVLARMGLHLFNREELLGRELDVLDLRWAWRVFWEGFIRRATGPLDWFFGVYRSSVLPLWRSVLLVAIALISAYSIGLDLANSFALPTDLMRFNMIQDSLGAHFQAFGFFSSRGALLIFLSNLRALALAAILGVFTFGVMAVVLLMAPVAIIGYFAGNAASAGMDPSRFLTALVLPHGLFEIPAALLAGAVILEVGMSLMRPDPNRSLGRRWIGAVAEAMRVGVALILPLLAMAAIMEVFVTPRIALLLLGGG